MMECKSSEEDLVRDPTSIICYGPGSILVLIRGLRAAALFRFDPVPVSLSLLLRFRYDFASDGLDLTLLWKSAVRICSGSGTLLILLLV